MAAQSHSLMGAHASDPDPQVIVCQGPPRCALMDDEAVAEQQRGCVWCARIICHPNGTETIFAPGNA